MDHIRHYTACGLSISSELEIPGLTSLDQAGHTDLHLSAGIPPETRATLGAERIRYISHEWPVYAEPQLTVWTGSLGVHRFRYRDGTEFIVDARARHVAAHWEEPLTSADVAIYFIGPVLGFVMRLRGIVPLHASAVATGRGAIVFIGAPGSGKSTTAAACATLGYPVLSDDLLPILETEGRFVAHPSHPRLTVWPDSAAGLFGSADELPALTPTYEKRYLDLQGEGRFCGAPVPIDVIYTLGDRFGGSGVVEVRTLSQPAALMTLVSNTYGNYLLDAPMRAQEFDQLSRLARHVPVRRITFGNDFGQLMECCQRLLDRESSAVAAESL
jgi:hypothetical protein